MVFEDRLFAPHEQGQFSTDHEINMLQAVNKQIYSSGGIPDGTFEFLNPA